MSAIHGHVLRLVFNSPWAILPQTYEAICEVVRRRVIGGIKLTAEEIESRIGAARVALAAVKGKIAILPLHGILGYRANLVEDSSSGVGTSLEIFGKWFDSAVADSSVGAIVIDVDSPGGSVEGVQELAAKITAARGTKRIVSVANAVAASAAYWIATAAEEVIVTPSGMVGSVGVLTSHVDISKMADAQGVKETLIYAGKYKVEGNPLEPLADEARAEIQRVVDAYYEDFVSSLAKQRGVSKATIRTGYGEGRMFKAEEAVAKGMADRVATLDEVLGKLGYTAQPGRTRADGGVSDTQRKRQALAESLIP